MQSPAKQTKPARSRKGRTFLEQILPWSIGQMCTVLIPGFIMVRYVVVCVHGFCRMGACPRGRRSPRTQRSANGGSPTSNQASHRKFSCTVHITAYTRTHPHTQRRTHHHHGAHARAVRRFVVRYTVNAQIPGLKHHHKRADGSQNAADGPIRILSTPVAQVCAV